MNARNLLTLSLLLVPATAADAGIVSANRPMFHVSAPPSLEAGRFQTNSSGYAFDELQNVYFAGVVDVLNPTIGRQYTTQNPGTTFYHGLVSSHIIHTDPGRDGMGRQITGTVTFSEEIVALIYLGRTLDYSDQQLGDPGTTYPLWGSNRGFEGPVASGLDAVRVINPYTVQVTMGDGFDQVRVLTRGVPAPGPAATMLLGILAASRRRRSPN